MGDSLGDVTGIVFNAFGFYRILPLTAVSSVESASVDFPSASFNSTGDCRGITVGSYNAENLNPESAHLPGVIDQIIEKMLTPDVIFLQEVQDGSGDANDGVVSGNATLMALSEGIESKSGVVYEWAEVAPVNNQDGGAPGGNIRQAYL
jgi:predicted extracellular nuclease